MNRNLYSFLDNKKMVKKYVYKIKSVKINLIVFHIIGLHDFIRCYEIIFKMEF